MPGWWKNVARRIVPVLIGSLAVTLAVPFAHAAPMHVMESKPAAEAVMDGLATAFFIRFDGPVDHAASRLVVVQNGKVVQTLHPRLQSQPNVLYSVVSRLAAGSYTLEWTTRSMHEQDVSHGEIPFTVR